MESRRDELNQALVALPDPKLIQNQAEILRARLSIKFITRDWRTLPYDDVRRFLHFLFSDNPRKNDYGIFVDFKSDKWRISFKGCFDFPLGIITDKTIASEFQTDIKKINADTKRIFEEEVAKANKEYEQSIKEMELCNYKLKPNKDYL